MFDALDWWSALLVLGGVGAGYINTLAGGGSALTIPLLMMSGVDANIANGTNRLAVGLQSAASTHAFHRRGIRPWGLAASALPSIVAGALIGAYVATQLPPLATERIFGGIFLTLACVLAFRPTWLLPYDAPEGEGHPPRPKGHLAMLAVGFYGGLFQAGVGIPLLLVCVRTMELDLVRGNGVKVILVFTYTALIIGVFSSAGQVDWARGGLVALGAVLGSWLGVRSAVARGAEFIRRLLLVALILAAGRYLGVY